MFRDLGLAALKRGLGFRGLRFRGKGLEVWGLGLPLFGV